MTTIKQDSHVYRLLTFLSYVGEYPLCSLQLLGSKEVWRKLVHKHAQRQEYRIPGHANKITCRLLLITGKGKSKSVRLSKGGQNILEVVNPDAALYYTQNYLRHNHAGEAKRLDRFHRVAESAALIKLAGFETCPYELPQLQMVTIHKVITDAPSFYISKELKYVGDDDVNKTSFSRITGALFYPGGCYAVYNSRDYLMNWNGRGEAKVRLHLTEIARMNAGVDDVQSGILLGAGYEIAEITLRTLRKTKRAETEFSSLFFSFLFIKLTRFADLSPGGRCPVPVNLILDEFNNIGRIGGAPDGSDFCRSLSVIRSRDIRVMLAVQSLGQLQNRYPNNLWSEIIGNCDIQLMTKTRFFEILDRCVDEAVRGYYQLAH